MPLAVALDVSSIDRLKERPYERVDVVEIAQAGQRLATRIDRSRQRAEPILGERGLNQLPPSLRLPIEPVGLRDRWCCPSQLLGQALARLGVHAASFEGRRLLFQYCKTHSAVASREWGTDVGPSSLKRRKPKLQIHVIADGLKCIAGRCPLAIDEDVVLQIGAPLERLRRHHA